MYKEFIEFLNNMYKGSLTIPKEFGKYLREFD